YADDELGQAERVLRLQHCGTLRDQPRFLIARTEEQNLIERAELRIPARQQLTRRRHLGSLLLQAKKRVGMRSGTNRDDGAVIGHRGFSSRIATAAFARSAATLRRRATCAAH